MKKTTILILTALALALPASASAITLDPGDRQTVVCGKQPFRGGPFARADTGEALLKISTTGDVKTFADVEGGNIEGGGSATVHALIRVRKTRVDHTFRLATFGLNPVRWRGC